MRRAKTRLAFLKPETDLLIFVAPGRLMGPGQQTGTGRVRCRSQPTCSLERIFMRTYDFFPLWRSTIGIDSLFDLAEIAQRDLRFAT